MRMGIARRSSRSRTSPTSALALPTVHQKWIGTFGCVFNHPNDRVIMDTPSPSIRDLARRLLAVEAASQSAADRACMKRFGSVRNCESALYDLPAQTASQRSCGGRWLWPARKCLRCKASGEGRRRLEGLEELVADAGTERRQRGGGRDHRPSARAAGHFHRRTPHAAAGARGLARHIAGQITFEESRLIHEYARTRSRTRIE